MSDDLTRPIIGIENRTPQEVFDIMRDRITRSAPSSPGDGWVMVPRQLTRKMRHECWKADYLSEGASDIEATVLAANREADPEEVESANAAYQALIAAAPSPGGDQ